MSDDVERRLPLVEERARIDKRVVERKVRIRSVPKETQHSVSETLRQEQVDIRRVPVNREIDAIPELRVDGDLVVIPVVEERAVLVKRLVLVEELHIQRRVVQEIVEVPVSLHSTDVFVESDDAPNSEQP